MKKLTIAICLIVLSGCVHEETAIEQLSEVKKPAVVFSEHKASDWWDTSKFTIIDSDGNYVEIDGLGKIQIIDKYNIGDTIK